MGFSNHDAVSVMKTNFFFQFYYRLSCSNIDFMGQQHEDLEEAISLREVRIPDDEPFLKRLFFELRLEDPAWATLDDIQKTPLLEMQYNAQNQHYTQTYPKADHYIIEFGENTVGRLMVNRDEHEICCIDLTILSEYRNGGIGSLLLHDLRDESSQNGRVLSLNVLKTNPAINLYDRLGLKIVGDEGAHWKMEWRVEASIEDYN